MSNVIENIVKKSHRKRQEASTIKYIEVDIEVHSNTINYIQVYSSVSTIEYIQVHSK